MSFSVILTEKGGSTQQLNFEAEEITIWRVDENDICLPKGNISKKHTRIVVKDGRIIVLDLKSTNGTYVNGKKLAGPQVISPDDKVYIGDFILNVEPPDLEPAPTNGEPQDGDAMAEMPTMTPARPHYVASEATHRDGQPQPPPKAAPPPPVQGISPGRSEEHTSELQSPYDLVCRLLLENKIRCEPSDRSREREGRCRSCWARPRSGRA